MTPRLLVSDARGRIFAHPTLEMLVQDISGVIVPEKEDLIALPRGSTLFYLPGHQAIGLDPVSRLPVRVDVVGSKRVFPVAAFPVPGYLRLYLPASRKTDPSLILPLWPYTAVGYLNGKFCTTALKVDRRLHQSPRLYSDKKMIKRGIRILTNTFRRNRLVEHLSGCALVYNCRNAQNLFLGRWEAPLPVSPTCNARCLGCLSFQGSDCAQASHQRIDFVPHPHEVAEVAVFHLTKARGAMVSFGQGCEGEPLLQFRVLLDSIRKIRQVTSRGRIHLNTNGYHPGRIAELAQAGLGSVRISLNSFIPKLYDAYYRPRGYSLDDVLVSVREAKRHGLFVSLNLLVMPGFTDTSEELLRAERFLKKGYVDLLQTRNLSIDPALLTQRSQAPLGLRFMLSRLKKAVPTLRFGYFNPPS